MNEKSIEYGIILGVQEPGQSGCGMGAFISQMRLLLDSLEKEYGESGTVEDLKLVRINPYGTGPMDPFGANGPELVYARIRIRGKKR